MTGVEMGHISAMPQLDRRFRTLGMDGIRHLLHLRDDLRTHIKLTVKRYTAQIHRTVSDGRHSYSTARYTHMVVFQLLRRRIITRHILKRRTADDAVPQRYRP